MKRAIVIVALVFAAGVPAAFAYQSPGAPSGYVNDFAAVLSAERVRTLGILLEQIEQTSSNEIVVVTVPSMDGDYIENYAVRLFEEWGIGKKSTDNGILLLLSIEERKIRIEVGYGLEGALPDSVAKSIIDTQMTPLLKEGDYDNAVQLGVTSIDRAVAGEYREDKAPPLDLVKGVQFVFVVGLLLLQLAGAFLARSTSWWAGGVLGFVGATFVSMYLGYSPLVAVLIIVLATGVGLVLDYLASRGYAGGRMHGGSSWRSGGGGFGGFGGGRSGGGGASGGW